MLFVLLNFPCQWDALCCMLQKQLLSSVVSRARCGPDSGLCPCVLRGVLWSNASPPHYGCLSAPGTNITLFLLSLFIDLRH